MKQAFKLVCKSVLFGSKTPNVRANFMNGQRRKVQAGRRKTLNERISAFVREQGEKRWRNRKRPTTERERREDEEEEGPEGCRQGFLEGSVRAIFSRFALSIGRKGIPQVVKQTALSDRSLSNRAESLDQNLTYLCLELNSGGKPAPHISTEKLNRARFPFRSSLMKRTISGCHESQKFGIINNPGVQPFSFSGKWETNSPIGPQTYLELGEQEREKDVGGGRRNGEGLAENFFDISQPSPFAWRRFSGSFFSSHFSSFPIVCDSRSP